MIWVVLVLIVGSLLAWLLLAIVPVAPGVPAPGWPTAKRVMHNVVAHPLLVLCPRLGWWLHDRTAPPNEPTRPDPTALMLVRETVRLIAAETLDLEHLDDLDAQNTANGHDEDSRYDQRLHEIIQRRRREVTTLQRTAAVGGASPFASPCQRAEHWLGGSVGVGLHLGALGDPGACHR